MKETIIGTLITVVVSSVFTGVCVYAGTVRGRIFALRNGMLSLLRAEIIRSHDKYEERGYCPLYAKEALEKAYNAYHALGGNGAVTKQYKDTMKLPEKQKEEAK